MTGHWRINTPKKKYHAELFLPGPVRNEAKRLAKEKLKEHFAKRGERLDLASAQQIEVGIHALLYNAQEYYLRLAKFNLEERK